MNKKASLFRIIKNIFFPPVCIFCDRTMEVNAGITVCDECSQKLPYCSDEICCIKCGKPIVSYGGKRVCYFCMNTSPLYYDRIVSVFRYRDFVRESVRRSKLIGNLSYAKPYAELMTKALGKEYSGIKFDFICSAPSHKSEKETESGCVELMAKYIAAKTGIPFLEKGLKKTRKTQKQTDLGYEQRLKNVRNSMAVSNPDSIKGKVVLLVDDVCTTRATIIECSRALKQAGAKRVYGLTAATTEKDES